METMRKLVERFNRRHQHYRAFLDEINSYSGWYIIHISDYPNCFHSCMYRFSSCKEFSEWMKGVVLE